MSVNTDFEKLDITRDEFEKLSLALHKDEFRKLFLDYCEEIQDPKNRQQYEAEIKQLEAERGVEVIFLNPEPGFVVETSVNGDSKCFLNIAKCDKVAAPTSEPSINPKNGIKGVNWSIPHGLPPPRDDFDDQNRRCQVFDVIFHPEALFLAEKNAAFRQCLIDTACTGIEQEFKVRLDRVNITFPELKFKGIQRSSVIRKLSKTAAVHSDEETSLLDNIFPPKPLPNVKAGKLVIPDNHLDEYSKPKYVLKHRRPVDISEMTNEIDAKINVTIPKELMVEIELPLLSSAANCTLDVTGKWLYFVSEKPAKYKLNVELPYSVNDKDGSAKFDADKRKLVITLPVKESNKERCIQDLYREDSGVESDIRDDLSASTALNSPPNQEPEIKLDTDEESEHCHSSVIARNPKCFLKNSIKYTFPRHFDLNVLDETIAIVLHVRNVDNESIDLIKGDKFFHIQFTSIGAGFYPAHYAFYFEFVDQSAVQIDSVDAEAWDNNVVLSLRLKNFHNVEYYHAGLDSTNLKLFRIKDEFILNNAKEQKLDDQQSKLEVSVELSDNEKSVQIEIKPRKAKIFNYCKDEEYDECKSNSRSLSNKNRKKNKKHRSFSESTCDDIKQQNKKSTPSSISTNNKYVKVNDLKQPESSNAANNNKVNAAAVSSPVVIHNSGGGDTNQMPFNRKQRSYSESRNQSAPTFKGILKHNSRCSSIEEQISYSCSIDGELKCSHSFSDIPEENTSQHGLSESCKKTVRFSDVIKKNIFRMDSSILGRRKLNQKKKNKKRALQRRHSEGDSADYEDNKSPNNSECCHKHCENERKSSKHDSGLDLSTQGKHENPCSIRNRIESESSDLDSKNSLMFDIDI